jgi:predicted nucleic acid-binding protein
VKVFLDSSVILSACGSQKSLSRLITLIAKERRWHLISSSYCRAEVAAMSANSVTVQPRIG